jgi:hypothetical protein
MIQKLEILGFVFWPLLKAYTKDLDTGFLKLQYFQILLDEQN